MRETQYNNIDYGVVRRKTSPAEVIGNRCIKFHQ